MLNRSPVARRRRANRNRRAVRWLLGWPPLPPRIPPVRPAAWVGFDVADPLRGFHVTIVERKAPTPTTVDVTITTNAIAGDVPERTAADVARDVEAELNRFGDIASVPGVERIEVAQAINDGVAGFLRERLHYDGPPPTVEYDHAFDPKLDALMGTEEV